MEGEHKMRSMITIFTLVYFLLMAVCSFASEAIVIDKKDFKVELSSVKTKKIIIDVNDFEDLAIPIEAISSICLTEDEKELIIKSITGRVVQGTSKSDLVGEWELGTYSVSLSDIKSIELSLDVNQQETSKSIQQDGFCTLITDWNEKTMVVFNFEYMGRWWYSSPFINRSSYMNYEKRKYLPVKYKEMIIGIPFTDIDTVKFSDTKPTNKEWEPVVDIKLVDGSILKAKLARLGEYAPKFTGESNGDFVGRIRQITFDHKRDKNVKRVIPEYAQHLNSEYKIRLKTSQGHQIELQNACLHRINDGYKWALLRTSFKIKLGESNNDVEFNKIKSINLLGDSKAQMITTSGKNIDVLLPDYNKIWIGGNIDRFGPARIKLSQVSSLEISKSSN